MSFRTQCGSLRAPWLGEELTLILGARLGPLWLTSTTLSEVCHGPDSRSEHQNVEAW